MASYNLLLKKPVAKDVRGVPQRDVERILKLIETLANEPRPNGCEKLLDREIYRIRQGRYRILYEILDQELVVLVIKGGSRDPVYD